MPPRARLAALLAALLLIPALALAQANVYRWVDKSGKVHYSDTLPVQDARNVTQKRLGGGSASAPQLPFATRIAMEKSPAILYVSPTCGEFCKLGRELLVKRGIPFDERDVSNPADADAVKKLIGSVGVPVLVLGEKAMKGYGDGTWHGALDVAGYPRTAIPGQLNPPPPAARQPAAPPPEPPAEAPGNAPSK